MKQHTKKIVLAVVIVLVVILIASQCFAVVQPGCSGVSVTLGAVNENVLAEGFHAKAPFVQEIVQVDNRTKKVELDGSAASRDLQEVTYSVAVNYRVSNASSASLYKNIGPNYESVIIMPAIPEVMKAVCAQFTAEELITKRSSVSDKVKEMLAEKLAPYGINLELLNIVDFQFSPEFSKAVEAKQTAQQNALKAEQDLVRIEVEAKQKVTQAQAEADSIKLIQETLKTSPEYIEYIKWNRWDGMLPKVLAGESGGMILDVGSMTDGPTATPTPQPTPEPTEEETTTP